MLSKSAPLGPLFEHAQGVERRLTLCDHRDADQPEQDAVGEAVKGADVVILRLVAIKRVERQVWRPSFINHRVRRLITVGGAGSYLSLLVSARRSRVLSFLLNVTQAHYTACQSLLERQAWAVICPGDAGGEPR